MDDKQPLKLKVVFMLAAIASIHPRFPPLSLYYLLSKRQSTYLHIGSIDRSFDEWIICILWSNFKPYRLRSYQSKQWNNKQNISRKRKGAKQSDLKWNRSVCLSVCLSACLSVCLSPRSSVCMGGFVFMLCSGKIASSGLLESRFARYELVYRNFSFESSFHPSV